MASTIQLKRGSGAPTGGDLAAGEPALDLTNSKLYSSTDGADVVEIGINPSSITTGTAEADHFKYGNVTDTTTNRTISAGEFCNVTAATKTITLPSGPSAGDTVTIGVGDFQDTVIARNGSNIMSLAEDLTVDKANVVFNLTYINASIGWRIA